MPKRVKFSIIIPCFNSARVIDAAIESVRAQSCPFEIVVVDGESTDDTLARVRAHGELIAQCVSEPDRGIYDAINKGLSLCTGDLIGVLGSDDRYTPGAFDAIAGLFVREPADIFAGRTQMMARDGTSRARADEPYGEGALISGIPFGHNAMFATPDAYRRIGSYDLRYRICADAHWVHRAIRAGLRARVTEATVVEFALEGTSSTNDDEIMAETYRSIVENFPSLTTAEARDLLFAARGWGPASAAADVLARHPGDRLLDRAVSAAVAQPASVDPRAPSGPRRSGLIRRIVARFVG